MRQDSSARGRHGSRYGQPFCGQPTRDLFFQCRHIYPIEDNNDGDIFRPQLGEESSLDRDTKREESSHPQSGYFDRAPMITVREQPLKILYLEFVRFTGIVNR